ncbi:YopX family protein [Campylobacter suis]|uniref:YopX protein domain-containing protein n=1 Tax=Campylobacter suis TaxID=2790657 RepID=A0ABM8Q5W4_9BACT|nr:YopX family protein [Campylobacter suis]CAD7288279.1 hypothetical protein LMG8286_01247 [Campylobacter suis]
MREIKFRVWDKELRVLRDARYIDLENGEVSYWLNQAKNTNIIKPLKNVEIMQCSGLEDKNGTLIYEGDIIEGRFIKDNTTAIGRVDYFHKDTKFICHLIDGDYTPVSSLEEIEVLGNIYENPKLLKKKDKK